MKSFSFRMKTDSWLFAFLLMAPVAPLAFTACEPEPAEINISLKADFSTIVAAIRDTRTTLTEKLSTIEKALSEGMADRQQALSLIQQSVQTLSGTSAEKLAAIETAIREQTTSLDTKLGLIEAAVAAGFADAKAQQDLLQKAIASLGGTLEEKMAAVEEAVKAQTTGLETKLGLIEAAVKAGLADSKAAQAMIQDALATLGDTLEAKLAAVDSALNSQTGDLSAKLALIETALNEGFAEGKGQQELIQQALESLTGTVEEKLAVLEEAVQGQTSSLETKLDLIEAAVSGGLADGKEQLALIQKAVAALSGDVSGQLSAIKAAIGSQTTSLETKLGLIEAAIQAGNADSATQLELIQQAIETLDGNMEEKLIALEQAISSQTSTLDTKLGLIEEAVRKGIASDVDAQKLIRDAVESLDGTLEEKLAAIESAMKSQTTSLETKLKAVADAVEKGFANSETAQKQIQDAIQSLGGTLEDKLAAIDTVLNNQTTTLAGKLGLIEGEISQGFIDNKTAQEKIQQVLSTLSGTSAEKLAAIQAAITSQTTTLAGKLEAIQGALATGFANEKEALILIKDAVASITTAVGTLDTNLSAKVKEVVDALDAISTNLSSDQIPKALADILKAIQDIKDYSDLLTAIATAIENLDLSGIGDNSNKINGHEYVDMGNGLKWATMNVGATKPEEYGDYFAWGEVAAKSVYSWSTYKWMQEGQSDWKHVNKYTFADNQKGGIWYDGDTFIGDNGDGVEHKDFASYDYVDDAARKIWGSTWRTPTDAEWTWLRENCTWTWTADYDGTGKTGMVVTSNVSGFEGNSIFLPATGCRTGTYLYYDGSSGRYWSSSLYEGSLGNAKYLILDSEGTDWGIGIRSFGITVRSVIGESLPAPPIINGHEYVDMGEVTIDEGGVQVKKNLKWATCNVGAENPWDYGDYFAWGATVPYYKEGHAEDNPCNDWIDGKDGYNWKNYSFMQKDQSSWNNITKYTFADGKTDGIWYQDGAFIGDGKKSFADDDYADDAARQNWKGTWRTPTDAEWTALRDKTLYDWVWTTDYQGSGKNGMLVIRKEGTGPCAGNSIFLPAASYRSDAYLLDAGFGGNYWSSSLYGSGSDNAGFVSFYSGGVDCYAGSRYYGQSVRPVSE